MSLSHWEGGINQAVSDFSAAANHANRQWNNANTLFKERKNEPWFYIQPAVLQVWRLKTKSFELSWLYRFARVTVTKQHGPGTLNGRNLFSRISGASRSRIWVTTGWVSSEASLLRLPVARDSCFPSTGPSLCTRDPDVALPLLEILRINPVLLD